MKLVLKAPRFMELRAFTQTIPVLGFPGYRITARSARNGSFLDLKCRAKGMESDVYPSSGYSFMQFLYQTVE